MNIISRRRISNATPVVFGAVLLALLLAATGLTATAQAVEEVRAEFHQTYPLAPGGRVSLENIQGAVRITGWDRNEVRVDAVKRAYTAERLAEAEIKIDASPDSISVKTKYPRTSLSFNRDAPERYNNPASVEYTLSVPRSARLDNVALVNGALDIEGFTGTVEASSVNGRLTARGLSGRTKLSVINGGLEADFTGLRGTDNVELSSVNGSLSITIPSDANAEVRANTVHGGINNDFGLPVRRGQYVGRDLGGTLGRGGALIKLSNVNGSINLRRASDGRTLSPATNLLSEARKDDDDGDDDDELEDAREEAREAVREAANEAREAARDAERERRDAQKEIEKAQRDGQKEIEDARRDAEKEREHALRDAQRDKERALRDAQRDIERAKRDAEREVETLQRDIEREAERASRVHEEDGARRHEQESKSFPASGATRVRVETFDGHITVHAWDKPEVMYTAFKRASDEKEMRGIRLRAEQSGGETILVAEFDKSSAHGVRMQGDRIISFNSGASVNYEVYVPRNAAVRASSGDGRLSIDGVNGEVDLHTGDGTIQVNGGRGRLRAETGDGRISVVDFDGAAEARTGDGRITLEGRFTQLAARTGDGSISLALPNGTNATIETDAESVVNDGVAVAEDGGGSDAENAERPKRVRRWRLGNGGSVFSLRTGDGQIVLRQR